MGLFDRIRGDDDERVVFLGIDGVPLDLVEDHPDVFENLTDIAQTGTAGRLESIVPPESSACWPSLTTGVNPGETGVYGFQDREIDTYETYVPMGQHVKATRVWDRVTDAGRDATVLNVPVTFPPSTRIQRQVSGFLSPDLESASSDESVASSTGSTTGSTSTPSSGTTTTRPRSSRTLTRPSTRGTRPSRTTSRRTTGTCFSVSS